MEWKFYINMQYNIFRLFNILIYEILKNSLGTKLKFIVNEKLSNVIVIERID
jgi:hypothetical protein